MEIKIVFQLKREKCELSRNVEYDKDWMAIDQLSVHFCN